MKICLVNNLYKPFNRGGAERIVELTADNLELEDIDVRILSTRPYFCNETLNDSVYYITSLYYSLNKIPKFLRFLWHIIDMFDFYHAYKMYKYLKIEKPDLVITHNLKGISFLLPRFIKFLKIKHIHVLHDIQLIHPSGLMYFGEEDKIEGTFGRIYSFFCSKLFSYPDLVISPSKWLLGFHKQKGFFSKTKTDVLPNPISSTSKFQKEKHNNVFEFLYVGLLESHKGVDLLIRAFRGLGDNTDKAFKLNIVGDGVMFEDLKNKFRNSSDIHFQGKLESQEVTKAMAQADCLVVPSLCYENSPTVIYEAVALSLPVIASNHGGITELIHRFGGMLFQPGDYKDLSLKMQHAIVNKKNIQDEQKLPVDELKNYNPDNYVKKLLSLIS